MIAWLLRWLRSTPDWYDVERPLVDRELEQARLDASIAKMAKLDEPWVRVTPSMLDELESGMQDLVDDPPVWVPHPNDLDTPRTLVRTGLPCPAWRNLVEASGADYARAGDLYNPTETDMPKVSLSGTATAHAGNFMAQPRGPVSHELKCWPRWFQDACEGLKHFEIRRNDRDVRAGDVLVLREWDPDTGYTGFALRRRVTLVMRVNEVPEFEHVDDDLVAFGLEPATPADPGPFTYQETLSGFQVLEAKLHQAGYVVLADDLAALSEEDLERVGQFLQQREATDSPVAPPACLEAIANRGAGD